MPISFINISVSKFNVSVLNSVQLLHFTSIQYSVNEKLSIFISNLRWLVTYIENVILIEAVFI